MKYVKTFESFMNEGGLFKTTMSPIQSAAENISRGQAKIGELKQKMSDKPEDAIYIKAQIDVEKEKLDVLKAQINAETAKQQLASRKEFEKKQAEYAKQNVKK
jgi:hypothetical protein